MVLCYVMWRYDLTAVRSLRNEEFENVMTAKLKEMMFACDLDTVTSREVHA